MISPLLLLLLLVPPPCSSADPVSDPVSDNKLDSDIVSDNKLYKDPVILTEDTSLYHQTLRHGDSEQYVLHDLIQGEVYEFKVSFPASQPFAFTITFSESLTEKIPQRKLLDIEKEEFVPSSSTLYVTVTAHDYTRAVQRSPHVSYSVYYERVYHGIPAQAFKLIAWLSVLIPCAVFAALWIFRNWYDVKHEHVS